LPNASSTESFATAYLTPDVLADDYLARVDRGFDPRGRIDTISVEISICVHSNITDMNTDAQLVRATSFG